MSYSYNFKGCKAFIHTTNGDMLLSDILIKAYDTDRLIATITGRPSKLVENDRIIMLILHKSSVYEFQGTVRRLDAAGNQEIALFKGCEKEDRQMPRYKINLPATIHCLIIGNRVTPLRSPLNVQINNISQNGILVEMDTKPFGIGTEFQIKLNISKNDTLLNACVKRLQHKDDKKYEYGCALISRA